MIVALAIAIWVLLLLYAALMFYYSLGWAKLKNFVASPIHQPKTKITVIIPARNEAENIPALFNSLIVQDYPRELFEVIMVDDFSTDNTLQLAQKLSGPNFSILQLSNYISQPINSYKKKAIEVAVAQANGNLVVTTDADCILPPSWLSTIARFYETEQPTFIAMPVQITTNGSVVAQFQALDFMVLQGITGAGLAQGFHNMCNGANMAFEKKAFVTVNGFDGIDGIASGDDMLLMQKIAAIEPSRIAYLKSPKLVVETKPMQTWKGFFNQRIRWASKADKYQDKKILPILLLVYCLNFCLAIWLTLSFLFPMKQMFSYPLYFWSIRFLLFKTLVELIFLYPVAKFFGVQRTLLIFPFFQPLHVFYTVVAGFFGKFGRYTWKQRSVR